MGKMDLEKASLFETQGSIMDGVEGRLPHPKLSQNLRPDLGLHREIDEGM
jgi:hypothetical protein